MPSTIIYPFARVATHVVGLSLFRTAEGLRARLFARTKHDGAFTAAGPDETAVPVRGDFGFTVAVEGSGLLGIEPMGWSARPYRATNLVALGDSAAFETNGAEVPYESRYGDGESVNRTLRFAFVAARPGRLPVLRWDDGLGGTGEFVLNADNPGVVLGLRLGNADPLLPAHVGTLALDAASPWGARTVRFPE